jgi:Tol biopolymer transport system component
MHRRTQRFPIVPVLVAIGLTLAACGGGEQLSYQASGSATQAEVTYSEPDGASHTETVSLPWETTLKAGGSADFSLAVQNMGDQGDVRCTVLLGDKELGHADATQYASCEGSYRKSGGSLSVGFESKSDILPDGSPAVIKPTETPVVGAVPTEVPAAGVAPRTNGGGSGVVAFVGRQKPWPTNRTELFLLQFDGSESTVVPLTEGIGWADHPTWSPDGSKLLFTRAFHDSGSVYTGDLWAWDVNSSELADLTGGSDDQRDAAWSPDGAQVLFVSNRDGNSDIFVADADGSGPTNLTSHGAEDTSPQWSSDGDTIYFLSDRADGRHEIYGMDADGGNPRQLTQGDQRIWWFAVSPDGQQLAFLRDRDIHVSNADGTGETNLTNEGTKRHFPTFAWSPDGGQIAFDSARSGDKTSSGTYGIDIYVMDADGSNVLRLTTDPEDDENPQWTPDGSMITFVSKRDGARQLYLVNSDGTGVMRLAERQDWRDFRPAWQPAVEASGQVRLPDVPVSPPAAAPVPTASVVAGDALVTDRIVFASTRADGSDLTQLTENDAFDGQPAWSPDGAGILFVSDRDGNPEIYHMAPDGSAVTRLTDDPGLDEFPEWSPNSQLIAFVTDRGGDADIYLMRADGSDVTPFVTGPGKDWAPAWSFASSELAFTSDRDGAFDLYVADTTGNVRRLTEGLGEVYTPSWTPNGRYIAFAANPDDNYDIYIIKPDGTGLQRVTYDAAVDYMPKWSPDSSYLLFVSRRDGNPEIYVVDEAGETSRITDEPADDISPAWGPMEE